MQVGDHSKRCFNGGFEVGAISIDDLWMKGNSAREQTRNSGIIAEYVVLRNRGDIERRDSSDTIGNKSMLVNMVYNG